MAPKTPKGYFPAFKLNEPMNSGCVVKVLESRKGKFTPGDILFGYFKWQKKQILKIKENEMKDYTKVDTKIGVPLSYYLGVMGMPGMTAYFGLIDICKP